MKKILLWSLILILIILLSNLWTVSAHGGEPRLELSADRLNPGATLGIRGYEFDPEAPAKLSLVGSNLENALGDVEADLEGGFIINIVLPKELPEGTYRVRAVSGEHDLTSPALSVSGIAITSQEEGQRGEEEALLGAMPTVPPAYSTSTVSPIQNQEDPPPSSARNLWTALVLGLGAIILGGGLRVLIQLRGRRSNPD